MYSKNHANEGTEVVEVGFERIYRSNGFFVVPEGATKEDISELLDKFNFDSCEDAFEDLGIYVKVLAVFGRGDFLEEDLDEKGSPIAPIVDLVR